MNRKRQCQLLARRLNCFASIEDGLVRIRGTKDEGSEDDTYFTTRVKYNQSMQTAIQAAVVEIGFEAKCNESGHWEVT